MEGSTALLHELGAEGYAAALAEHRRILRAAFAAEGGVEVDTQGDAFFFAFPTGPGALAAAAAANERLAGGPIRVRTGVHTGTPLLTDEGYVGVDVHRAARIAACGHGGQVLVSSTTASLAEGHELVDLGLHRLKDLSAPERIYQLGPGEHPPLTSLHQTNLPIPATPFLGREAEVDEVASLLARDGVRLVTLTGPGGTGKTRLALQAAGASADRHPHGVWWVGLAAIRDPALVVDTIGHTLGAKGELADVVADKSMLLLLDNFEQVVEAASAIASLLNRCPNLELLVTSREPLRIAGEHEYPVEPLRGVESIDLFSARARAADPGFAPDDEVAALCARLDHLPLALELAAARVKVLTPAQMLDRLDRRLPLLTGGARDAPERQRTLRATIEWSYDLLAAEEQELFVRMSVFRGGATLDDAEAVAGADLDLVQTLVDKSLVRQTRGRFWMLETIREFGTELLPDAVRDRHAEHFKSLVSALAPGITAFDLPVIERLDVEHDNLRAALDRFVETGRTQELLAMASDLARFWHGRGHHIEARRRFEQALAADPAPTAARAAALIGWVLVRGGDTSALVEAEKIATAISDERLQAIARGLHANLIVEERTVEAIERFAEPIDVLMELDVHWALPFRRTYAYAFALLGDVERSIAEHETNLAAARAHGNRRVEAVTLGALSIHRWNAGERERAVRLLLEGIQLHRELADPLESSFDLSRAGGILAEAGEHETAVVLACAGDALRDQMGAPTPWATGLTDEVMTIAGEAIDEDTVAEAVAAGRALSLDDGLDLAVETLRRLL